jgi:SSS family solute:Na+ symporter
VDNYFTPAKWFSFMLLWLLCVPMFPQMFMRFFISKSVKSLQFSAIAYPIVTGILFICPVIIGVWGHIPFPDLVGRESDQILPMMLAKYSPAWLAALIMIGALAAFMSTMDSQLLALSSILTRDLYLGIIKKTVTLRKQVVVGRILVIILAAVGLMIAYKPPATIFKIATQTFTGLAVLFPTTVAALYMKNATAKSCIISIVVGELLLIGFYFEIIPPAFTF